MKTSHKVNGYGNGCVGFGGEGREESRFGVKFLGLGIWLRKGNGEGEHKERMVQEPHFKKKGLQAYVLDLFAWCRNFCQGCFDYFSLNTKRSFSTVELQRTMEKDQHIFIQSRPTSNYKSVTCEVLQSPDKYNSYRGATVGRNRNPESDTHHPMCFIAFSLFQHSEAGLE